MQAAAGVVGASPSLPGLDLQLSVNAQGRLQSEEEFGDIVVKTGANGESRACATSPASSSAHPSTRCARCSTTSRPSASAIFQAPGSNAMQISDNVRATMAELKTHMPDGVDYEIVYDPTQFVRASIEAVVHTLLEAMPLVVLVVILFLQTWRASIIPLLAVPVSIIGTFAVMYVFGFSINALTLFGLVLAIGIVVDDAIVVVENVERNIEAGLSPREATYRAMQEVSGPIIAIALVLVAVFVPLAFISGLTGQFYRQFALTIAISTVISAINSLTLSPALAALLLKGHDAPKDRAHALHGLRFGWFFRGFNWVFGRGTAAYGGGVRRVISRKALAMGVYLVLIGVTFGLFKAVPVGFVPGQDKQYLVGFAQLPDGATLDRTEDVIRRMSEIALEQPGVENAVSFPGLSINGFTNSSNAGIVFARLKPFEERTDAGPERRRHRRHSSTRSSPASRTPSSPCSRRRRCRGSARSAASSCRSRIAPASATRLWTQPPRRSWPRRLRRRRSPGSSPASRSTCRSSMPTSIAPRRASSASRSPTCSTPCRSIWARSTSTTSTSSAAPTRCACRPTPSTAPAPRTSASSRCARRPARWCRSRRCCA